MRFGGVRCRIEPAGIFLQVSATFKGERRTPRAPGGPLFWGPGRTLGPVGPGVVRGPAAGPANAPL